MNLPNVKETENFKRRYSKIDNNLKKQANKVIIKILENPEIGKPMRYERKGTRELYLSSLRIAYEYDISINMITFLDIYHKDKQ